MESSREQVKNLGRIDDMDRTDAFLNNMHEFEKNMHDFIRLEVETGTTFASSAVETREPGRKQQDIAKSRKAYDTALHFLAEAKEKFPNDPVPAETVKKLQTLQGVLKNLGEQFSE